MERAELAANKEANVHFMDYTLSSCSTVGLVICKHGIHIHRVLSGTYQKPLCVRGYLVYKEIWEAATGKTRVHGGARRLS